MREKAVGDKAKNRPSKAVCTPWRGRGDLARCRGRWGVF